MRTFSLQALAELTTQEASLFPRVLDLLQEKLENGSPTEKSRARRLFKTLSDPNAKRNRAIPNQY